MVNQASYRYEVGGSLSVNAPSYVKRQADEEIYAALQRGEFCYVLNSRQMGKSSLRVQTMQKLRDAGIACAAVDLTGIGGQANTEEQWYCGIVNELIKGLELPESFDWRTWWSNRAPLAHVQRWGLFLAEVLLIEIDQPIVIFIDEIDSVLSLQFPFDDFFAYIRFCYNKRADEPIYERLTFCLLGVATPSDLIQDKRRTPFNVGQAIELTGFQLTEVEPLMRGIADKNKNPHVILSAVLYWTGGQPFLTQKICQLIRDNVHPIPEGRETEWVEWLVRSKVIENWESQDEPEHFRTIRNRLLRSERNASHLLTLYQKICEEYGIAADNSREQAELRLSGLVVKQQGVLQAYNPIYQAIFDQSWIDKELKKLQQRQVIRQRYELIEQLGENSTIKTYLAKDLQHPGKIQCILKQIIPPSEVEAFNEVNELFTQAYLDLQHLNHHPNRQIAGLIACFEENRKFYIIQEYVEGYNLDHEIQSGKPWQETDVVDLLINILEVLEFVHSQNLAHLNLKPANIRKREQDGKLVLIDFGILKRISPLTNSSTQILQSQVTDTLSYIPPQGLESWSGANLDIYAAGMIGVQALTGIAPQDLAIDKATGEVIWRFHTPEKAEIQVSPQLAHILDTMIRHSFEQRYPNPSEALLNLRNLKSHPTPKGRSLDFNRRLLVGGALALIGTNLLGFLGYRHLSLQQQNAQANQTIAQLTRNCKQSIQSESQSADPVNTELIINAGNIEAACVQAIEKTPSLELLEHQGLASLLLSHNSRLLKQGKEQQTYLAETEQVFHAASQLNPNAPRIQFYLGLTRQLTGKGGYEPYYANAIDAYLKSGQNQIERKDYPILSKLADYVVQRAEKSGRKAQEIDQADRLYEKAILAAPDRYRANLLYNRGVLSARTGNTLKAANSLGKAYELDPSHQYAKKYVETCIGSGRNSNPLLCTTPNMQLPITLPTYPCNEYPTLAIAKLGSSNPEHLCQ